MPITPNMEARDEARGRRAATVLWIVLCGLLAGRAAATVLPGSWLWGLDAGRFLPPWLAWGSLAVAALAAAPLLARPLARAGEALAARVPGPAPVAALAAGLAALVLLLPDRSWFVSDFILRLGAARGSIPVETLFPQSPPLDLLLHVTLPRALARWLSWDVLTAERALGAVKVAALAAVAARFTALLDARPAVRAGLAVTVAAGGWLALFTGYSKATADLCLVMAAVGWFGLRLARTGTGAAGLALSVAAGLLLHRSALALLPALLVAGGLGWRARRASGARGVGDLAWLAVPALVLAALAPRLAGLAAGLDRPHLAPGDGGPAAILAAAFAPLHLLDLFNLILLLAPVALAIPALLAAGAARGAGRNEALFFVALAGPWALGMLFVHPFDQGALRDWDTFAAAGVAFALTAAWLVAGALRGRPARAWAAVACAAVTVAFTAQKLLLDHDPRAAIARVEAYVGGSPRPTAAHRTLALDYLGVRYGELGLEDAAAGAYARAAAITPSPRMLYNWALAEADRGDYAGARAILERLLAAGPETPQALYTLGAVSFLANDLDGARRAVERSLALAPDEPQSRDLLRRIEAAAGPTGRAR